MPCLCVRAQSYKTLCNPRTVACLAPLFIGFSRQEYWSGLSFPSPGNFSDPKIEPASLASPALAGRKGLASREANKMP